ncbi:hypothetical protein ANSO36C_01280 [Nostoc cf. commune SO-36]|uniref:Uncharacterized protein n=1 Tax=Nostoc cf. commune SO-36 TaxID=449208 RepID=A0ABN6PTA0_NOSCO|nr:hypothetical protein ANSO36C_01280 [Nostoc cf. commune SO-36]
MVLQKSSELTRINARRTDVFDIFNFKHYTGSNPYLDVGALVFDFALIESRKPLPIEDYIATISDRYPNLSSQTYESHAHLFARVASEVGNLIWIYTLTTGVLSHIQIARGLASNHYMNAQLER